MKRCAVVICILLAGCAKPMSHEQYKKAVADCLSGDGEVFSDHTISGNVASVRCTPWDDPK